MYNRYIPTSDGGFQRLIVDQAVCPKPPEPQACRKEPANVCQSAKQEPACLPVQTAEHRDSWEKQKFSILQNFSLRQLDTGDILVILILLLLLVDGDEEELPCALLTIAAFLFL